MKTSTLLVAAALGLSAAGCGADSPVAEESVSCSLPGGMCETATAMRIVLDQAGIDAAACTTQGGTSVPSCTATGRVGRCTENTQQAAGLLQLVTSYYAPFDATTGAAACTANQGTWVPN